MIEIDGIKFYGSPWQPYFRNWAFNLQRGGVIAEKWKRIPLDTDVLITHGPPVGKLDLVARGNVGCEDLMEAVKKVKPKYHLFGHIHEGYGVVSDAGTTFINASVNTERYVPSNLPIEFEI